MSRDMTEAEFKAACKRRGFAASEIPLGYFRLAPPVSNTSVSILNAGTSRRRQLAYLIHEQAAAEKRLEHEQQLRAGGAAFRRQPSEGGVKGKLGWWLGDKWLGDSCQTAMTAMAAITNERGEVIE